MEYSSIDALADHIKNRSNDVSLCLLIGAGVSASGGIPTANEIIADLADTYPVQYSELKNQDYSNCCSMMTDGERRLRIQEYMRLGRVNYSSLAIARLVKSRICSSIITTNFDTLIEKALRLSNSSIYSHDFSSDVSFPSGGIDANVIIYLHGKEDGFVRLNTSEEIEKHRGKLKPLFKELMRKRIWVIIGYSGHDIPVYDALKESEEHEFGIYWVGRRNEPEDHIKELLEKSDTFYIKADDSDSFFRELMSKLNIAVDIDNRPKYAVNLNDIDSRLTDSGRQAASHVFRCSTDEVFVSAVKIVYENSNESYLHRTYLRMSDYERITEEYVKDPTINIIRAIIRAKNIKLDKWKSHRYFPTTIGQDAPIFDEEPSVPALLHAQVSYSDDGEPQEFLVSKYLSPISVYGALLDYEDRDGTEYSKPCQGLQCNNDPSVLASFNNEDIPPYTKTAPDLVSETDASELSSFNQRFFDPHSEVSMSVNIGNGLHVPYSKRPTKLLRINAIPDNVCNYNCCFCCQSNLINKQDSAFKTVSSGLPLFFKAVVGSGCSRIMITGGEPLIDLNTTLELISILSKVEGIDEMWVCTNGSLMGEDTVNKLYNAGLRKIVVSIAAATEDRYAEYTRQSVVKLVHVLENIEIAIKKGITVRVDIPVNSVGARSYLDVRDIIQLAKKRGVKQFAYFKLHMTGHNEEHFNELFIKTDPITWEFLHDPNWRLIKERGGRKLFKRKDIDVIIPAKPRPETQLCKDKKCGFRCQGTYAAYLKFSRSGTLELFPCHNSTSPSCSIRCDDLQQDSLEDIAKLIKEEVWYITGSVHR